MAKFYFDGHIRYRKSKDIMMTGVQNIVTGKHATYLEFPPLGFEPRFSFWPFYLGLALKKLVPGDDTLPMLNPQHLPGEPFIAHF